jgi:hypothetical protein
VGFEYGGELQRLSKASWPPPSGFNEWIFEKHFLYENPNLCYTFMQSPIEPAALAGRGGRV